MFYHGLYSFSTKSKYNQMVHHKYLHLDFLKINGLFITVCVLFLSFSAHHFADLLIYAEIPREMLARHDIITPYLNGIKYLEETPLYFWLQMIIIKTFGFHFYALRCLGIVFAILTLNVNYIVIKAIYNRSTALLCSGFLGCNALYIVYACAISPTMLGVCLFQLAFLCFLYGQLSLQLTYPKALVHLFWIIFAGATLTLCPYFILLAIVIFGFWAITTHTTHKIASWFQARGLCLYLLITLPWFILANQQNSSFLYYFFIEKNTHNLSLSTIILLVMPSIALLCAIKRSRSLALVCIITPLLVTYSIYRTTPPPMASLIDTITPTLNKEDVVAGYHYFFAEIPVLLQRTMVMVDWKNKPGYSQRYQTSYGQDASLPLFWKYWQAKQRRFFLFVAKKDFPDILSQNQLANPLEPIYHIATNENMMLLSNMPF